MGRPRVIVHMIQTVDGRITLARGRPTDNAFRTLAPNMTDFYQNIRDTHFKPQVLLCGSETILVLPGKKPSPLPIVTDDTNSLHTDYLPAEVLERRSRVGWYAVVDSKGRIRWGIKESDGWQLLVLVAHGTPSEYLAFLRREKIPYLIAGQEHVDPGQALEVLAKKLRVQRVVLEGGGRLNGVFLRAGLVDEVSVVLIPAVVGGEGTPTLFDAPELTPEQLPSRLRLLSTKVEADGLIWLRYEVLRENETPKD